MRISGGHARGITLVLPPGDAVRPATDAMRQAVFSVLAARVGGARFADLFAGSGAYGLEALSRGAAGGVFVEKNFQAAACIRRNLAAVGKSLGREPAGVEVLHADATGPAAFRGAAPELVFVDPPYDAIGAVAPGLFARLTAWLAPQPDPVIVFEMPGELTLAPEGWTCVKRLGKGVRQPTVCFFRANRARPSPA
ncbi:MAG: RsmD family RNA methyltransferase [Opitutae bacterium]|nr:RsmD family RNA methyltransferase [Opitutae bacterium]